jgi:uncharacterized membrane protein
MFGLEFFAIQLIVLLIAGPILGIIAWVKVRELRRAMPTTEAMPRLLARLEIIEQRLSQLEGRAPAIDAAPIGPAALEQSPAPVAAEPMPVSPPAPPPAVAPVAIERGLDLETLIAGRWLNRIGLLLVLIAVAYFLKLVIDNEWIGPTGQVTLGVLAGAGLLAFSQWLVGRGFLYFSEGITALGAGVLYLSLWAGSTYYQVFALEVAFVAMIGVTAATIAIAVGRDSQRIALLGLIGGFLTPLLVGTGTDAQVALFGYVAVLNAGLLAVAWKKSWRWLELPAFAFTMIYFWGWYGRFYYATEPLARTLAFAGLFFAQFSALSVIRARRWGALTGEQAVLVLLNGLTFLIAMVSLLYDDHRWAATFATLLLAAVHLVLLRLLPAAPSAGDVADQTGRMTQLLFAGLALTFVTIAIPVRLDGNWITLAFSVEAAVLMWSGFRTGAWQLRAAGFALFAIVLLRLLFESPGGGTLFLNERFATLAVVVASMGLALYFASRHRDAVLARERPWWGLLAVIINVVAVWGLSVEAYEYFTARLHGEQIAATVDALLARQLALSLVWTGYATLLMGLGVRYGLPALRWQALALFGLALVKVFVFDLAYLSGVYRVLSSIVLGLILVGVSFLYQRRSGGLKSEEQT